MTDRGKIDSRVFEEVIAPKLGADRDDVALGPRHGVDFGVLSIGDRAVAVATDPVSILPALGFERSGRLALDIVLTDVAVSGLAPTHFAITLTLPTEMTDAQLAATWDGIHQHARELGVSIVGGHTARYEGVDYSWVGGGTALGVGAHEDVIRPDGARPGDDIVLSTGPAAEVAGLFATLFPEALDLPAETVATAQERVDDILAVADARTITDACTPTALHDATEGGVVGGLTEMATGAGVVFDVERGAAPVRPGVEAVCRAAGVDPWLVTSAGTLLVTAPPEQARQAVEALDATGTPASVVGTVRDAAGDEPGLVLDGDRVEQPASDPSWDAMAALGER
ncbi:AIR synthase family protein [Haloarcula pelagica]|uniref:AIR synthase family protein n=1 Tax=Haloarcula pelagica TaxID=3033389 RepID=UPI0024C31059|nr:AIR synthase family protein [Halomicroarcula sp. YJ-61-S]